MSFTRRQFAGLAFSAVAVSAFGTAPAQAASRSGTFKGASGHVTKGTVTVMTDGNKQTIVLSDDFFFDGAPDPQIGFGRNGKYVKGTAIHKDLTKKHWEGASTHTVPASIKTSDYDEVYIWCDEHAVPLGVAKLQ